MAPRIPPLPFRKVRALLLRHGFFIVRQRGSHVFFEHPDGRTTILVHHAARDIPPGLVRKILRDADIDPAEVRS